MTMARHLNNIDSFFRVCWVATWGECTKHVEPMLFYCWPTVCNAGPAMRPCWFIVSRYRGGGGGGILFHMIGPRLSAITWSGADRQKHSSEVSVSSYHPHPCYSIVDTLPLLQHLCHCIPATASLTLHLCYSIFVTASLLQHRGLCGHQLPPSSCYTSLVRPPASVAWVRAAMVAAAYLLLAGLAATCVVQTDAGKWNNLTLRPLRWEI